MPRLLPAAFALILVLTACGSSPAPVTQPERTATAPARPYEVARAERTPSHKECREAVENILRVYGTEADVPASTIETCVEHVSADAVDCMRQAENDVEIELCQAMGAP